MKRTRIYFEVVPKPGDDDGWDVTRDGHVLKWHPDKTDALIHAIDLAVKEAEEGGLTGLRIKGKDGRIQEERTYPRSSDPARTPG